jgi:alpha-ketoglutarate-dependent taurine dioxygenase
VVFFRELRKDREMVQLEDVTLPATASMERNSSGDAFDESRVVLSGNLQEFLDASETSPDVSQAARRELDAMVRHHVDAGSGVLVLTGVPSDVDAGRRMLVKFSKLLGETLPQDGEGTVLREVRDRGTAIGEGARARYSDSRFGGNLHTDGAERPLPAPELFTLLCVRQSEIGGALQFVHIRDLVRALSDRPDVISALRAPFQFDRRGDQPPGDPPTTEKPVLFQQRGRDAITYLRSYIDRGHEHPFTPPLSQVQLNALDALDSVVNSAEYTKVGNLRAGELALFDNLSLLHGRTEFQDRPDHTRLLLRTWVRRGTGTGR